MVDLPDMPDSRDTICFTCGQAVQEPPRFNLLSSGEYCPACRERVLDAAPTLLPGFAYAVDGEEQGLQGELAFDEERDYGFDPPEPA